eukprot:TRINITY_DN3308_c1_g1_i1.p1 TRINITY_DN3308_c1_g1~~TRINITY_DN3308_c1_g1_i1.p1  ORF type:complete len:2010 (-),score=622.49 TRINITY_DN3308_c1_g1_i1:113-6142(-)
MIDDENVDDEDSESSESSVDLTVTRRSYSDRSTRRSMNSARSNNSIDSNPLNINNSDEKGGFLSSARSLNSGRRSISFKGDEESNLDVVIDEVKEDSDEDSDQQSFHSKYSQGSRSSNQKRRFFGDDNDDDYSNNSTPMTSARSLRSSQGSIFSQEDNYDDENQTDNAIQHQNEENRLNEENSLQLVTKNPENDLSQILWSLSSTEGRLCLWNLHDRWKLINRLDGFALAFNCSYIRGTGPPDIDVDSFVTWYEYVETLVREMQTKKRLRKKRNKSRAFRNLIGRVATSLTDEEKAALRTNRWLSTGSLVLSVSVEGVDPPFKMRDPVIQNLQERIKQTEINIEKEIEEKESNKEEEDAFNFSGTKWKRPETAADIKNKPINILKLIRSEVEELSIPPFNANQNNEDGFGSDSSDLDASDDEDIPSYLRKTMRNTARDIHWHIERYVFSSDEKLMAFYVSCKSKMPLDSKGVWMVVETRSLLRDPTKAQSVEEEDVGVQELTETDVLSLDEKPNSLNVIAWGTIPKFMDGEDLRFVDNDSILLVSGLKGGLVLELPNLDIKEEYDQILKEIDDSKAKIADAHRIHEEREAMKRAAAEREKQRQKELEMARNKGRKGRKKIEEEIIEENEEEEEEEPEEILPPLPPKPQNPRLVKLKTERGEYLAPGLCRVLCMVRSADGCGSFRLIDLKSTTTTIRDSIRELARAYLPPEIKDEYELIGVANHNSFPYNLFDEDAPKSSRALVSGRSSTTSMGHNNDPTTAIGNDQSALATLPDSNKRNTPEDNNTPKTIKLARVQQHRRLYQEQNMATNKIFGYQLIFDWNGVTYNDKALKKVTTTQLIIKDLMSDMMNKLEIQVEEERQAAEKARLAREAEEDQESGSKAKRRRKRLAASKASAAKRKAEKKAEVIENKKKEDPILCGLWLEDPVSRIIVPGLKQIPSEEIINNNNDDEEEQSVPSSDSLDLSLPIKIKEENSKNNSKNAITTSRKSTSRKSTSRRSMTRNSRASRSSTNMRKSEEEIAEEEKAERERAEEEAERLALEEITNSYVFPPPISKTYSPKRPANGVRVAVTFINQYIFQPIITFEEEQEQERQSLLLEQQKYEAALEARKREMEARLAEEEAKKQAKKNKGKEGNNKGPKSKKAMIKKKEEKAKDGKKAAYDPMASILAEKPKKPERPKTPPPLPRPKTVKLLQDIEIDETFLVLDPVEEPPKATTVKASNEDLDVSITASMDGFGTLVLSSLNSDETTVRGYPGHYLGTSCLRWIYHNSQFWLVTAGEDSMMLAWKCEQIIPDKFVAPYIVHHDRPLLERLLPMEVEDFEAEETQQLRLNPCDDSSTLYGSTCGFSAHLRESVHYCLDESGLRSSIVYPTASAVSVLEPGTGDTVSLRPVSSNDGGVCRCLTVSKDGRFIAQGIGKSVIVFDGLLLKQMVVLPHENEVTHMSFSADAQLLLTSCSSQTGAIEESYTSIQVFDWRNASKLFSQFYSMVEHGRDLMSLSFHANGSNFYTGGVRHLYLWLSSTQNDTQWERIQCVFSRFAPLQTVLCFGFSSDDHTICGTSSGKLLVLNRQQVIHEIDAHTSAVTCIAMYTDLLVTGGLDGFVRIWSRFDMEQLAATKFNSPVMGVDAALDNPCVASLQDGTIYLFDPEHPEKRSILSNSHGCRLDDGCAGEIVLCGNSEQVVFPLIKDQDLIEDEKAKKLDEIANTNYDIDFSEETNVDDLISSQQDDLEKERLELFKRQTVDCGFCEISCFDGSFALKRNPPSIFYTASTDGHLCFWPVTGGRSIERISLSHPKSANRCKISNARLESILRPETNGERANILILMLDTYQVVVQEDICEVEIRRPVIKDAGVSESLGLPAEGLILEEETAEGESEEGTLTNATLTNATSTFTNTETEDLKAALESPVTPATATDGPIYVDTEVPVYGDMDDEYEWNQTRKYELVSENTSWCIIDVDKQNVLSQGFQAREIKEIKLKIVVGRTDKDIEKAMLNINIDFVNRTSMSEHVEL